jgi:hypothetical protein
VWNRGTCGTRGPRVLSGKFPKLHIFHVFHGSTLIQKLISDLGYSCNLMTPPTGIPGFVF